jgi:hypothetical protein
MHQYRRTLVRAMMQESYDSRIIKIPFTNMISDLDAQVTSPHAAAQFFARRINILERYLAKRFQPAFSLGTQVKRCVVE